MYGEELCVSHKCEGKGTTKKKLNNVADEIISEDMVVNSLACDVFYDHIKGSEDECNMLQHIRTSHRKHKKDAIGGTVMYCCKCPEMVLTVEVVNMVLACSNKEMKPNVSFPLHDKQLHITTY
jgi:hypothetical protein